MRLHIIWSFLFVLFTALLLQIQSGSTSSAHEYDHEGGDETTFESNQYLGIVNPGISLSRTPELESGFFALNISSRNHTISSCIEFSDFEYEMKFQDIYLEIELKGLETNEKNLPHHPHYECDGKQQNPQMNIVLNRKDLEKNGTRLVKFTNGAAVEYFDLVINNDKIQLKPSESHKAAVHFFKPKQIYGRKDPLKLWLYPENTLILYIPSDAPTTENGIKKVIDEAAARSGLVPLGDIIPDFENPLTSKGYYYFVDNSSLVAARIETDGGALLDNIKIRASSYGLEGDIPLLKSIPVYAKKPGINE